MPRPAFVRNPVSSEQIYYRSRSKTQISNRLLGFTCHVPHTLLLQPFAMVTSLAPFSSAHEPNPALFVLLDRVGQTMDEPIPPFVPSLTDSFISFLRRLTVNSGGKAAASVVHHAPVIASNSKTTATFVELRGRPIFHRIRGVKGLRTALTAHLNHIDQWVSTGAELGHPGRPNPGSPVVGTISLRKTESFKSGLPMVPGL